MCRVRRQLELGGAQVADAEIEARVQWSNAATLGESNPFDLDEWSARKQVAAIRSGKRITGHTARLRDEPLWSYLAGGVSDDHNATTTEEVLERVRLGAAITVMAGSMNDNTASVFADVPALGDGVFTCASAPTTSMSRTCTTRVISIIMCARRSAPASPRSWPGAWRR